MRWEREGDERGRERIRRAYEWISSYAAGAVRLKLRSDFTYRTPRPYTYVCPRGEIRKKREKERPECFHFRSGLIKRCAYTRYDRPIVTTPRTIEARYPPRSVALSPFPVPTHSINQKVTEISLRPLSFTKLLKKTFLSLMSLK